MFLFCLKAGEGMSDQVLNKLVDSFDDFKERLIRIEERLKVVGDIQKDVDAMKISVAEVAASSKSAHKRLDTMEKKEETKENDIRWLKRAVITGFIGFFFTVVSGITVAVVKGWF